MCTVITGAFPNDPGFRKRQATQELGMDRQLIGRSRSAILDEEGQHAPLILLWSHVGD